MDFGDPAMMLDANSHQGPLVRLDPMKAAKRKRDEILPDSCDEVTLFASLPSFLAIATPLTTPSGPR